MPTQVKSKSLLISIGLSCFALLARALSLEPRQSILTLSTAQVAAFKPFTFYASTSSCDPSLTLTWTCGVKCDANPTFIPTASGGNAADVQFWFVGFDPTLQTVVVSHQGSDPSKIIPLITDADLLLFPLDPKLFPGVGSKIKVHNGFALEHARTATTILAAVNNTIQRHGANDITVVGPSLGAALALLEGVYLQLALPSASVKVIGYGMPRVGNQDFVDFVDATIHVSRVNNKKDPIPTYPFLFLGYHHPSGEKHILPDQTWVDCPGHDNPDPRCLFGEVPNLLSGNLNDHGGPYDGVQIGLDCPK